MATELSLLLQSGAFNRQQAEALLKMPPLLPLTSAQIIAALGYTPADAARNLVAGAGLVGGGDLTADRAFSIDPAILTAIGNALPLTSSPSTPNAVTGAGHTHTITGVVDLTSAQAIGGVKTFTDDMRMQTGTPEFVMASAGDVNRWRLLANVSDVVDFGFNISQWDGVSAWRNWMTISNAGQTTFGQKVIVDNGATGISGGHLSLRNTATYVLDVGMGTSGPTDPDAFLVNRHASGAISFFTGSPGVRRLRVNTTGVDAYGNFILDCSAGTTFSLQVLQPGSSPAGSTVQITSPNGAPGIISMVSGTKRRDVRFTSTGIELSASSSTSAGTNNVTISEGGDVTAAGAFVDALGRVRYAPVLAMTANLNAQSVYSGRHVVKTVNSALQFSLQPNATVAVDVGVAFPVTNDGSTSANLTIARGSGVTCYRNGTDGNITLTPGQSVVLYKVATDRWQASN